MDLFGREDPEEYRARRQREWLAGGLTHEKIKEEIAFCDQCPLRREGGLGPILSTGPSDSPLMIVGEGPGQVEDIYGAPLVGPSGQLLDKALWSVGITRDHVYVTNIVKCRPRGNRTPTMDEGAFCADIWLKKEIQVVRPKVIVALGKVALRYFLKRDGSIMRERGKWISYENIPVMPTYHPAFLLRQEGRALVEAKWQVFYDLQAAKERASKEKPDWVWKSESVVDLLGSLEEIKVKRQRGSDL